MFNFRYGASCSLSLYIHHVSKSVNFRLSLFTICLDLYIYLHDLYNFFTSGHIEFLYSIKMSVSVESILSNSKVNVHLRVV